MNANISQTIQDNGGEWDSSWASLEGHMLQLFTRGAPGTMHQLWQRCYFEDLWGLMGRQASSAKYLEIGAGRGTTSMYLASKGCDVTMLDLAPAGFKVAASNFAREGLKIPQMIQADARDTRLPAESYDCIFSIGLLEHFEDPRPVLKETVRLLKPGGLQFAVIIPERPASVKYLAHGVFCPWVLAHELMPESLRAVVQKWRGRPEPRQTNEVLRTNYRREDYVRMLESLEIDQVRCIPYNAYHPVYSRPALEAGVAIPMYRTHRALKRVYARYPLMATAGALASCDLLTFRKANKSSREASRA